MTLLRAPESEWSQVAICTHGRGNHAVIDDRYRYIRYADGSEELYDHTSDPREWFNLAGKEGTKEIAQRLAMHLPQRDDEVPPAEQPKRAKTSE